MKQVFPILFTLFLAVSCVEPIVMDPLEEMPVVVQCVLQREGYGYGPMEAGMEKPVQYLDLFYARRPSETQGRVIDDAKVVVKGGGASHSFQWNGARWECAFLPEFGAAYELAVTLTDGTVLRASTTFPDCLQLQNICLHNSITDIPYNGRYWFIRQVNQTDSPVTSTGKKVHDIRMKIYEGDCFLWVDCFQGGGRIERLCSDHKGTDDFNVIPGSWRDLESAAGYQRLMEAEAGFFGSESVRAEDGFSDPMPWKSFVGHCSDLPLHARFLRIHHPAGYDSGLGRDILYEGQYTAPLPYIMHQDEEGNTYNMTDVWIEIEPSCLFTLEADAHIVWAWLDDVARFQPHFLSAEYDHYLRDILNNNFVHAEEFAQIYSSEDVYTNIQGGVGIFGCRWDAREVNY